jgi:predicted metallopeptidase
MDYNIWAGEARVSSADGTELFPTVGSLLLLKPTIDFAIGSETLSCGSTGQFNVQFSLSITNPSSMTENMTIYLVCFNSGYCVTGPGGSTQQITSVLTESDVIAATTSEDPVTITELNRQVGSGMFNKLSNAIHKVLHKKHNKHSSHIPDDGGARSGGAKHSARRSSRLF